MSDVQRIRLYSEGDEERAALDLLVQSRAFPDDVEVARQPKRQTSSKDEKEVPPGGIEAVYHYLQLAMLVDDTRSVALLDLDDATIGRRCDEFCKRLRSASELEVSQLAISDRVSIVSAGNGAQAAIVAVGLSDDASIRDAEINWFAFDDYLVRLTHDRKVYEGTSQLNEFPYELASKKIAEISDLMRRNGVPLDKTKRVLQMLMGITGFRSSPAEIAARLIRSSIAAHGETATIERFQPLVGDILAAISHLRQEEP